MILDGQQRLATSVIILSAIREWLRSHGKQTDADQIQGEFIGRRELGGSLLEPRIILNRINNPTFAKYVVGELPDSEIQTDLGNLRQHDPNRRLLEAVLLCRSKIRSLASKREIDKSAGILYEFVNYLEKNVKVVRLVVPSEANAYTVFETLNDRGLDLTALDLVKNYIFGRVEGKPSVSGLYDEWLQMMSNLVNVRADDFLKTWWTSRHGRVQTAQLFARFRDSVRTVSDVVTTAEDMLRTSEQYAVLEVADDPLWSDYSENARAHIRALKVLGGSQTHPVILAAIARWEASEIERLLRFLEIIIIRYQLIGGGRTGKLEIGCAALASAIYAGRIKNAREAARTIPELLPSDKEFRERFEVAEEKSSSKTRLMLTRLEVQARLSEGKSALGPELEPRPSLTVEHILPRNPDSSWKKNLSDNPSFSEEYTYRLGNLCLLTQANRKIGNASFDEKCKTYSKSDLLLTNELCKESSWTPRQVEERQRRLAKLAVTMWRFE